MKQDEYELFEAELRRQKPAAPPPELMRKLLTARPRPPQPVTLRPPLLPWPGIMRWLIPATALVVGTLIALQWWPPASPRVPGHEETEGAALKAADIQINAELLRSFDAVARLPGGEPVRFRCSEWLDEVTLRDKGGGLVIEQRRPRVEVIPVRFETY